MSPNCAVVAAHRALIDQKFGVGARSVKVWGRSESGVATRTGRSVEEVLGYGVSS